MPVAPRFLILAVVLLALPAIASEVGTAAKFQEDRFDPMRLGVPQRISGYPVLAVQTDDNFVCMRSGEKRLIFQSPQATIEGAFRAFPKQRIEQALQALHLENAAQWGWDIVGPGATREQLVSQLEQSYNFFSVNGCPSLGVPITASPAV